MQTLKCDAMNCTYNVNAQCNANTIQVNSTRQETYCDTYTKDSSFAAADNNNMGALSNSLTNTEFGSELTGSPRISCTATKCAYNNSFHCKAQDVKIDNPSDAMICHCNTYREK